MIADSATGSGFTGAIGYTTSKAEGEERGWRGWASEQLGISEPVDAVQTRNILLDEDPEMAAEEMRVTANQNERVKNERYSVSLSYHPDDEPYIDVADDGRREGEETGDDTDGEPDEYGAPVGHEWD